MEAIEMTLEEALQILRNCDPGAGDCPTCPLASKVQIEAHDAGIDIVFTTCAMLQALQESLHSATGLGNTATSTPTTALK